MNEDILKRLGNLSISYIRNKLIRRPTFLKLFLIFIVAIPLTLGYNLLIEIIQAFGNLPESKAAIKLYNMDRLKLIVNALIMAPIVEEIIFRGILYMLLRRFIREHIAVIVSALCFGIYHMDLIQSLYAFIFGFALVAVIRAFKDLFSSIFMHFCANLTAIFCTDKGIFTWIMNDMKLAVTVMIISIIFGNLLLFIIRFRFYGRLININNY